MDLKEVCQKAVEYSGEKCISQIMKNDKIYVISMCDDEGHTLIIPPVAVTIKGEAYDYTPLNDTEDDFVRESVPIDYCSTKGMVIDDVIKSMDNSNKSFTLFDLLDTVYEKYELYSVSPFISCRILSYYVRLIIDLDKSKAYRFIMGDRRTITELIKASSVPLCSKDTESV